MRRSWAAVGILSFSVIFTLAITGSAKSPAEPPKQAAALKAELGLDASQTKQMEGLIAEKQEKLDPLQQKRIQTLAELRRQVGSRADSHQVQETLDQLKQTVQAIDQERLSLWDNTAGFLSPAQRARLVLRFFGAPPSASGTNITPRTPENQAAGWGS